MTNLYPASPGIKDPAVFQPTTAFRLQIVKVIGFILLFFLLYAIVLLTAITLGAAFITAGIALTGYYPNIFTFIAGPALAILGGLMLFLLVRFLFYRRPPVNPYRAPIEAHHHPRLFDFISRLVKDTRIRFPEKVFVVPEVNVAVFYNASFFNLLWPARMNLEIGLGLVNSVNISEFKMILAQEFAHFSRRSMKLGSYVYALNKVLYNMLYENDSWNDLAIRWSSHGSLPGFFAHVTLMLVNSIQFLLRKLYRLINRQYLELSREMEFHADALAVSLAGTAAAISGGRRVEMGTYCLDHCMHKLSELENDGQQFSNIFQTHRAVIDYYARQNRLDTDAAGLPVIPDSYFHTFLKSRVQLREQWTTHPTREDREQRYLAAGIICEQVNTSAWQLFDDPELLQEQSTRQVYDVLSPGFTGETISPAEFVAELTHRHRLYEYPAAFHDYYDNRAFTAINTEDEQALSAAVATSMAQLYHPDIVWRIRSYYRDKQDVETLQAIAIGQFQTRTFEFDGQSRKASDARELARQLARHVAAEQDWLQQHDRQAYGYHYQRALAKGPDTVRLLTTRYQQILMHQEFANRLNDQVVRVIHAISQVFNASHDTLALLMPWMEELRAECWRFRRLLHEVTSSPGHTSCLSPELYDRVQLFTMQDCIFMQDQVPDYAALQELHEIISSVMEQYNNSNVLLRKSFLEFLLTMEPEA
ncbi:M48 family metalloprotease [Chitinophaga varians]|uniref:M48 family metalloprotease n=1 Tax=Chitinophaga varians TaxID=2202339 RepID=A0A847RDP3_9BACT|nr:M48 family metallopeptidase [Chitinophaga varians]NLR64150.1 M48 family metalloprotease [Chitinophaga varians]